MPAPLSAAPRRNWMASINTDNGAGLRSHIQSQMLSITTTGNTLAYFSAPEDGYLHSIDFTTNTALAANDTNYVTFVVTNLGQGGSGNTVMTSTSDANTTKATGGSSITTNAKRSLLLSSTPSSLRVTAGDRIKVDAIVTGTLAGALGAAVYLLRFNS